MLGLSTRHDDEAASRGPERLARLPADLEQRLSEAVAAARGHARHARRLGVEDRRAGADESSPEQQHGKAAGVRQHDQAYQGAAHAGDERIGLRPGGRYTCRPRAGAATR
jgi:hypothetical protein